MSFDHSQNILWFIFIDRFNSLFFLVPLNEMKMISLSFHHRSQKCYIVSHKFVVFLLLLLHIYWNKFIDASISNSFIAHSSQFYFITKNICAQIFYEFHQVTLECFVKCLLNETRSRFLSVTHIKYQNEFTEEFSFIALCRKTSHQCRGANCVSFKWK